MNPESGPRAQFPPDFLWGVSTSAHQVEGGTTNNQWARWEQQGRIRSGDLVGAACNWWELAEQDFDIAQQIGLNALRISVEWSRIEPRQGEFDLAALARYRGMLRSLRARGIRPFVTLHHFTNPQWFEDRGAFLSPESVGWFARFTQYVVEELGDDCSDWVTFNEPNVYAALGYQLGHFPPGLKGRLFKTGRVTSNLCLAHAEAYRCIHRMQQDARVGWAQHFVVFAPEREGSEADQLLCRLHDRLFNGNFADTLITGNAPFPYSLAGARLDEAHNTFDFIGLNVYSRFRVSWDLKRWKTLFAKFSVPADACQGDHGVSHPYGEAFPEALSLAARRFSAGKRPIYFLEHGVPDRSDRVRPWLIESAVQQLQSLLGQGCDLRGYFHWTLTDNFEWNEGWHLRFGLIELNPLTQERRWRRSAETMRRLIRQHRCDVASHAHHH